MDGIKNINKLMIDRASFKDNTKPASPVEHSGPRQDNTGLFDASNSNLSTQQTENMRRNIKNIAAMAIDPTSDVSDLTEKQIDQEIQKATQGLKSANTGMEIDEIKRDVRKLEGKIYEIGGNLQDSYVKFLKDASVAKSKIDNVPIKGSNFASAIDRAFVEVF
jgi:hypothetical protein